MISETKLKKQNVSVEEIVKERFNTVADTVIVRSLFIEVYLMYDTTEVTGVI